jgi:glycosidase
MEFHVSRAARDRYAFDQALFSLSGNVILPDFRATREVARRMNEARDARQHPELAVQPGQLNAMGLIDEILHHVSALYRQQRDPQALERALAAVDARLGKASVDGTLAAFIDRYPPGAVYRGAVDAQEWMTGTTDGLPNRQVALEELVQLWLANANPAFAPFLELFDDAPLAEASAYRQIIALLAEHFAGGPRFGPQNQDLVAMLRSPAIAEPTSLPGQLRYIREHWGLLLSGRFMDRLVVSLDVLAEDERALWLRFHGTGGVQHGEMPDFAGLELEPERFSMDRDWMPRLVLMAKSIYVWLDQLAKAYQREIRRLDQVPDEELDRLARWGFTGLWLIGLWERSRASERIKRLRGNPEAVASAYSLLDYRIADDLGGEAAYENLRERAWRRGIRLASDMVPNHMGIDSAWVVEHPDWFISLDQPPYPAYSYGGPDLSSDPRVGIWIEDHYYDNSDAAVVFRREDRGTGENRFIYHGNDGTSMPWNDTAQLDYLKPEVREAVIQTILAVARRFPVIRFDAAMTLAKKHFQRLWYPEPGTGGAIPSRAEHGMTRAEFDRHVPVEFWREVVDRVAAEAPDTLLLAEAFWLMEGYFVRTLGMHRVYNSAFMNMLRDEENANYRSVIRNTLEFDPEILKRYVNFMNNPDERTAIDQFGTGDKYFGIATLMATLPGLPMFGHGQVEGYAEKYGMEFRRAYWDERPNEWLVARHEQQIFPLLHRRHLFAGVQDFLLYDLVDPAGHVNEDVFAYSNRAGGERSLVVYHNRYAEARGWIRQSVGFAVKGPGDERGIVRRTLGEGLGLTDEERRYCIFRDQRTGLEYLRSSHELCERGLYIELGAYQCHVFLAIREVSDDVGLYAELASQLGGEGAPSIDAALRDLALRPVQEPVRALVSGEVLRLLLAARRDAAQGVDQAGPGEALSRAEAGLRATLEAAARVAGGWEDADALAAAARDRLDVVLGLPGLASSHAGSPEAALPPEAAARQDPFAAAAARLRDEFPDDLPTWAVLLDWALLGSLGRVTGADGAGARSRAWLDAWGLTGPVADGLRDLGLDEPALVRAVETLRVLLALPDPDVVAALAGVPGSVAGGSLRSRCAAAWLADPTTTRYLGVNQYGGVTWFDRDAFRRLVRWSFLLQTVELRLRLADERDFRAATVRAFDLAFELDRDGDASGYRVDGLLALETAGPQGADDAGGAGMGEG